SPEDSSGSGLEQGLYTAAQSTQTYLHSAACARSIIESGHDAIVDATFLRRSERVWFAELAQDLQVDFVIVPFDASETELRRRIAMRQASGDNVSEATWEVLESQIRHREPLSVEEETRTRSVAELLKRHV
ncbi:MAG: ATP-binding protein, partial [Planctomycetaceae bacterium]|nr:ATP-binding protein [Planctomycetaceae bacterium]